MSQESHVRDEIRKELLPYFEELVDAVVEARSSEQPTAAEADIARAGDQLGAQAIGQWLYGHDTDDKLITVDDELHYRLGEPVAKTYHTSRGPVRCRRHVYRPSGEHNGKTVSPLEAGVGMIEGKWSPGCAEAMAYAAQELPERAAAKVATKMGAMDYSHNSFKRLARRLAACWEQDRAEFEAAAIEAVELADEAARLAVSLDRVSLLVAEADGLHWRMAYCGTLCVYDGQGDPLETLRYGRMPQEGADIIRAQLSADVAALRCARPDLEVVCISDGAAELCNILAADYPEAPRYIDFYHLAEKLAGALRAFCSKRATTIAADEVLSKWKTRLLNQEDAISDIERVIQRWNARDLEVGGERPVHQALTYIDNHKEQMRYARARGRGHPIGSGHVEACCKQLVQARMKRNGQRWKQPGGQAILTLRSLATDARWEAAMEAMLPEFKRRVEPVAQAA